MMTGHCDIYIILYIMCIYSTNVMRYDPRLDQWLQVADMNVPRGDFSTGVVNNCIIVAGGRSRRGYLNTCEMYDPSTNTWKFIAKLPEVRLAC